MPYIVSSYPYGQGGNYAHRQHWGEFDSRAKAQRQRDSVAYEMRRSPHALVRVEEVARRPRRKKRSGWFWNPELPHGVESALIEGARHYGKPKSVSASDWDDAVRAKAGEANARFGSILRALRAKAGVSTEDHPPITEFAPLVVRQAYALAWMPYRESAPTQIKSSLGLNQNVRLAAESMLGFPSKWESVIEGNQSAGNILRTQVELLEGKINEARGKTAAARPDVRTTADASGGPLIAPVRTTGPAARVLTEAELAQRRALVEMAPTFEISREKAMRWPLAKLKIELAKAKAVAEAKLAAQDDDDDDLLPDEATRAEIEAEFGGSIALGLPDPDDADREDLDDDDDDDDFIDDEIEDDEVDDEIVIEAPAPARQYTAPSMAPGSLVDRSARTKARIGEFGKYLAPIRSRTRPSPAVMAKAGGNILLYKLLDGNVQVWIAGAITVTFQPGRTKMAMKTAAQYAAARRADPGARRSMRRRSILLGVEGVDDVRVLAEPLETRTAKAAQRAQLKPLTLDDVQAEIGDLKAYRKNPRGRSPVGCYGRVRYWYQNGAYHVRAPGGRVVSFKQRNTRRNAARSMVAFVNAIA